MRDRLLSMTSFQAQTSAFKMLDQLQRLPQHEQVASLALGFLLICKRFNQSPRDMCELAEKFLADALSEGRGEQVRALQNYLRNEL